MRLSFPRITRSDEQFLFALYSLIGADETALAPLSDEQKNAFLQASLQAQHQYHLSTYPQGKILHINLDSEKVGRLCVCELENEIQIIDLIVLSDYRGRGIGTKIISDILQKAKKLCKSILNHLANQSIYSNGLVLKLSAKTEFISFGNAKSRQLRI
jgi:GNAT superfamily N-acetyltransferase